MEFTFLNQIYLLKKIELFKIHSNYDNGNDDDN